MEPKQQKTQPRILIVDDDPEMRLAMHIRLKANNFEVGFAVDGVSAVAEARRQRPDVILLDLGLPAGDGFTVLERLQGNDSLSCIPVIVVSGRDRAAHCDQSVKAGARLYLQKPFRNADLLLAIDQVLGVTRPPRGPVVYDISGAPSTTEFEGSPVSRICVPAA